MLAMEEDSLVGLEFDQDRQALAKRYQREAVLLGLLGLTLFALVLLASLITGMSQRLETWARSLSGNHWLVVALYVTVAYLSISILGMPLRMRGRRRDLKYRLTKQSWSSWAVDRVKSMSLGLLLAIAVVEALYWSIRNFGGLWWLIFWFLAVGATLVGGYIAPVLLLPLFYRVEKVADEDLNERLLKLAGRAGVRAVGVYEFKSSPKTERGVAALAGLGRTRRILLSDHIAGNYTEEEVEGILAHELAHHVQRDSALQFLLSSSISLLALFLADLFVRATITPFGISTLSQVANLPLFALFGVLFSTAIGPLSRYASRTREARADMIGASLCGNPRSLATALVKLHNQNLSDASPSPIVEALFYTHPSGRKRVAALLSKPQDIGTPPRRP